jgi:hypothetical protein
MTSPIGTLMLAGSLVVAGACTQEAAREGEAGGEAVAVAQVTPPDTTAAALWAHLESADYRANWATWPEKGTLYTGQEPHGMLLTTYLNAAALEAVTTMAGVMPAGAIIVKENYMPDSTFAAATIMYKVPGYDAEHNDWFWVKRNADGTVDADGRAPMCQGCHAAERDNDYVFTGRLN